MKHDPMNWLVLRVALLASLAVATVGGTAFAAENSQVTVRSAFHIVGAPGVKRNARVDLYFTSEGLRLKQGDRDVLAVPYDHMTSLEVLDGTRTYAKATYASVLAFGVPGALMLTKKKHVDTLVLDYVNERGGQIGLIVQVPAGQGAICCDWVRQHKVKVHEPEPLPAPVPTGDIP
jgi:hypothetical protein